jgi:hypothetical protein
VKYEVTCTTNTYPFLNTQTIQTKYIIANGIKDKLTTTHLLDHSGSLDYPATDYTTDHERLYLLRFVSVCDGTLTKLLYSVVATSATRSFSNPCYRSTPGTYQYYQLAGNAIEAFGITDFQPQ